MAFLLTCCGHDGHIPDISGVQLDVQIDRFDEELFAVAPEEMAIKSLDLQQRYGVFYQVFVEQVLRAGRIGDPQLPVSLIGFTQNPDWQEAQRDVENVFGDMEREQKALERTFARISVIFPNSITPHVITYNSGFNYGVMPMDSILGIGLEWFIGPDKNVVRRLAPETFPQYMKERMHPGQLLPSVMKAWLMAQFSKDLRGEDLLTQMVEAGKIMVLLEAILPEVPEHDRAAFKPEQLKWAKENEFNIWKTIIDEELLYSKKEDDIGRLMNDGPFTNGFPRESPGHIGEWVGAQMVRAYLNDHKDIGLQELFAQQDPQRILKSYRPR